MESKTRVRIRDGREYDHLFPRAHTIDKTVKKGATVADTVEFIPLVARKSEWQAKAYVDQELRGLSTYAACEKLWNFLKQHIQYKKDERGYEQVRTWRRMWHDRLADCDCFTNAICTALRQLRPNDIKQVVNRITEYDYSGRFSHIYPVVMLKNGQTIIMDVVAEHFNYEVPYTKKEDHNMDLQVLDGIDEKELTMLGIDAQDLLGYQNDLGELGKLFKKSGGAKPKILQKAKAVTKKVTQKVGTAAKKVGAAGKKALHVINKVNPATALLRAGVLASMKLNTLNVGGQLKYAYLTEDQAREKGADMSRFGKLKNILTKLENIFHGAGGEPKNLKLAILTGKGNPNREVPMAGLEGLGSHLPLSELLGIDVYHGEFVEGMDGLNGEGLGEPATATALAAASSAIAAIAGLLKVVGNVFPKRNAESGSAPRADGDESSPEVLPSEIQPSTSSETEIPGGKTDSSSPPSTTDSFIPPSDTGTENGGDAGANTSLPANKGGNSGGTPSTKGISAGDDNTTKPKGGFAKFYEENKKWIKPVGIGIGGVAVLAIGYAIYKKSTKSQPSPAVNGVPKTQKNSKGKKNQTKKAEEVSVIKLM